MKHSPKQHFISSDWWLFTTSAGKVPGKKKQETPSNPTFIWLPESTSTRQYQKPVITIIDSTISSYLGAFFFFFWQTECFFNTNPETKEKVVIFQKSRKKNHFLSLFVNINSKSLISKWNKSRKKINFYILWEETETNISLTPERLYITAPFILDSFPAVVCWYVTLHFP